tara:strand:- start:1232 stop:1711 length:480 start_codon:yes stop_codon:yes gene_type:complete
MKDKERIKLKDSKLFKFAKEKLPNAIGKGLEIFGDLTGKDSIENLGNWIQGQTTLTPLEEIDFNKARELDLQELDIIEKNLTERHKNDMLSDSWLSKNVRPIVVLNFTALIDYVILSAIYGRPIEEQFVGLLMTLGVSTIGGYFAIRTVEKRNKTKYND